MCVSVRCHSNTVIDRLTPPPPPSVSLEGNRKRMREDEGLDQREEAAAAGGKEVYHRGVSFLPPGLMGSFPLSYVVYLRSSTMLAGFSR